MQGDDGVYARKDDEQRRKPPTPKGPAPGSPASVPARKDKQGGGGDKGRRSGSDWPTETGRKEDRRGDDSGESNPHH
jgi:hypothetical protein